MKGKILVTGAAGMIGSRLVEGLKTAGYAVVGVDVKVGDGVTECDLNDREAFFSLVKAEKADRIIHLAALAHTIGGKKYPKELYHRINVECAKNVFDAAKDFGVPVLFSSTVDVYGFCKGVVGAESDCKPVSVYGKTKYLAETALKKSGAAFDIFRFSPVYTETIKRDIQKRYYLKYPKWAYLIGKGGEYEILNIEKAVAEMIAWCGSEPKGEVRIVKDDKPMLTAEYVKAEREEGRAKHVLRFPRWLVLICYAVLRLTGKNKYTYLLNKAVYPLRTK